MTMRRLEALQRHWRQHPRLEWLAAAWVKYRPPVEAVSSASASESMAAMIAQLGLVPGGRISG